MDRFESISTFIAVVEAGGIAAASRKLNSPITTVSRKISELEQHLRVRLLIRAKRKLSLTEAGQTFYASSREVMESLAEAERVAIGEYSAPRGRLTITAPIVFGRLHVVPIAVDFRRVYPEIELTLQLVDRVVNILDEHVDLAVRLAELPDSSLIALRIGAVHVVVCASPDYLARHGRPETPNDLPKHQIIGRAGTNWATEWPMVVDGVPTRLPVRAPLSISTADGQIAAAVAGAGLALVRSYQVAELVRRGDLELVLRSYEPLPIPVSLVHAGTRTPPLKLRAFLDFAAPRLKLGLEFHAASIRGERTPARAGSPMAPTGALGAHVAIDHSSRSGGRSSRG